MSLKLGGKVVRRSSHGTQLLATTDETLRVPEPPLLDVVTSHIRCCCCCYVFSPFFLSFEDRVCHKAKQHNYTGPITHSI